MKKILLAALLIAPTGCTHTADIIAQLKGDPAIVTLNVNTVYGTVKFNRVGSTNNAVTVAPDGTITIAPPRSAVQ